MHWLEGKYQVHKLSTNRYSLSFDRSIHPDFLDKINAELETDIMIRAIHDVKGIDMGNSLVRYKVSISMRLLQAVSNFNIFRPKWTSMVEN